MRDNITIGKGQIVDLFSVSGVPVGTNTIITLVTDKSIRLYLQPAAPVIGTSGYIPMDQGGESKEISGNILGAWAYSDFGAVVNFSEDFTSTGGTSGGGGGSSIATDMYFSSTADRDAFATANPDRMYQGVTSAVENGANYDYYQYDSSGKKWLSANRIYQGKEPFTTVKVIMLPDGSEPTSIINGDELDLGIPRSGASPAPRQAVRFLGMFEAESELNLQEPSPREGSQCIVLTPAQDYYEFTKGVWVKGRSVGDAHNGYLDRYVDLAALKLAHPTAPKDSTAIAGLSWYIYEVNSWEALQDDHIPAIDNKLQTLEAGQQTLENNLGQKISGLLITDEHGNQFSDIKGIKLIGGTASDDDGDYIVDFDISPFITIADGQEPGSKSVTGNAIVIDGANISNDPSDKNVIILDIPSSGNSGIEIDNGTADMAGVKKLNFPTSEILAKSPTEADIIPYFKANDHDGSDALIEELNILPPLQLNKQQGQQFKHDLIINPRAYEPQQPPSFLGKASEIKVINSGVDSTIFCNEPITQYGMYFSPDNALEGIEIQEDDSRDPNLGGQLTELLGSVGFHEKAPLSGNIKVWFMRHQNGAQIPTGYVIGTDGNPLIMEKAFNPGDDLKVIIFGAYYAQGQETITMHVEHSFTSETVAVNPDKTMLNVNQFENGSGTSISRIEFLRRNGIQITPAIFKFDSEFARFSSYVNGITEAESEIQPGQGEEYLAQFGVNNLTKVLASIQNGILSISDNGTDLADYYIDFLVDNTRTQMMRGKEFNIAIKMQNDNLAFQAALFTWTGNRDEPSKIYSSRGPSGSLNLNTGWTETKGFFIAENTDQNMKTYNFSATIPENAVNVAFVIYPNEAQSPSSILLEGFHVQPKVQFTGYTELEFFFLNEVHLGFSDEYLELGQNSQGYQSLRYTLNYDPINGLPLPMGEKIKGGAKFTLDKTRNMVSGSQAKGGEGVLVAPSDGQVAVSFDFLWWNEQNTDTVTDLWLVLYGVGDADGQETKIVDSNMQFTIPKNSTTHGIAKTAPAITFEIEKGQAFGLRGSANKNDGSFLESTKLTDYMVRPVIDFKELSPIVADDPWANIDFTQYTNSYFNNVVVSKIVENSDTATFIVDLPIDGTFTIMEVLQEDPDTLGSITGKNDFSFSWNKTTKEITFDFKKVGSYRIMMMLSI